MLFLCQVLCQCQVVLDLVVLDLVVLDQWEVEQQVVALPLEVLLVVLQVQAVPQPLVVQSQVVWANLARVVKVAVLEQAVLGLQAFGRHQ